MILSKLGFTVGLCIASVTVTSIARAEDARDRRRRKVVRSIEGLDRKLTEPLPALSARLRSVRLPTFLAPTPQVALRQTPLQSKAPALSGNGDCARYCVERRGIEQPKRLASRVLAGVASAGLATGVVLVIVKPSRPDERGLVPSLRLRVGGERAVALARWKF